MTDGGTVTQRRAGDRVGTTRALLTAERTALNLTVRMSGVATHTAVVDAVAGTGATVLDTRKTTPGLRALEKYAVRVRRRRNNRMGLYDVAMVKDNHNLAAGGVAEASPPCAAFPDVPVEVEVTTDERARPRWRRAPTSCCATTCRRLLRGVVAWSRAGRDRGDRRLTLTRGGAVRRDRRGLSLGRCADPLRTGARHRLRFASTGGSGAHETRGRLTVLSRSTSATRTPSWRLFEGESTWWSSWRIATDARRTADELGGCGAVPGSRWPATVDVDGIAPVLDRAVGAPRAARDGDRYYPARADRRRGTGVRTGVPVLIDNPKEVGTDRVVNAVAAVRLFGGPCIVVDFGTTTNFDVISARGEFLGGAIAPGIEISVDALGKRGAQLRKVELTAPDRSSARTRWSACSRACWGSPARWTAWSGESSAELGAPRESVTVVATGGLAPLVIGEAACIDVHEPWLTLIGLRLVFERNA